MMLKLYKIPQSVDLYHAGFGIKNENRPMGNAHLVIQKYGLVSIDLVVRNNDRKPIDLTGYSVDMIILDRTTGRCLFKKPIDVIDATKGKTVLNFQPNDLFDIEPGQYLYSVTLTNTHGITEFLQMDQKNSTTSFIEIRNDSSPRIIESTEVDMTPSGLTAYDPGFGARRKWYSESFMLMGGIITVAVYTEKYYGKLWIQGSLSNQPTMDPTEWFDLNTGSGQPWWEFKNFSGIETFNFEDNIKWIRFVVEPDDKNNGVVLTGLGSLRKEGNGILTKILFRG